MPNARIHVDFNDMEDGSRLVALRRHADSPLAVQPGGLVELWDEDGNTAQGRVVELQPRDIVLLDVLWDTWRTADDLAAARGASVAWWSWESLLDNLASIGMHVTVTSSVASQRQPALAFARTYQASPPLKRHRPFYYVQTAGNAAPGSSTGMIGVSRPSIQSRTVRS